MENPRGKKRDYNSWSQEQLIERVTQLENELRTKTTSIPKPIHPIKEKPLKTLKKPRPPPKPFDASKYSTRLVAFKLAYLGKRYNGFEHHSGQKTPLPTIEEELWKALMRAKLIFPTGTSMGLTVGTVLGSPIGASTRDRLDVNWEGCEYSKCGRTDRGVSAFGQVIAVRVRSNRPLSRKKEEVMTMGREDTDVSSTLVRENGLELASAPLSPTNISSQSPEAEDHQLSDHDLEFDPILDEIPYAHLLNKLLPPDIRILAWCPSPPLDFSARFSCRERRYRYFFTQPAFLPLPHHLDPFYPEKHSKGIKDGWLDIEAMRKAAKLFEGLHDFRNFCKVDPSKQITNFERRIFKAEIEEVPDATPALGFLNNDHFAVGEKQNERAPRIYTFTLHGSAFLWHQVRHMVAILFLVGQGLESPSLVTELLDIEKNPRRPIYEMASDTPLVLWDCIFPRESEGEGEVDGERKDALEWLYVGDAPGQGEGKFGVPAGGVVDDLWRVWRERKIDEVLAGNLLGLVTAQGKGVEELSLKNRDGKEGNGKSQRVFDGSDGPRLKGNYEVVMKKERMDTVEVINERYAVRKGFESAEELKKLGFRRLNKVDAEGDADE